MNELIAKISEACKAPLPGWNAQKRLINYSRPAPEDVSKVDPHARLGAVLALLYPKNGELYTVLMMRNTYKGVHSDQVSFPGGKFEKNDGSLWNTALREAHEEVGVIENKVIKISELTKVYIPPSRFLVTPFLAFAEKAPDFIPDKYEVKRIIEAPVSMFLDRKNILEKNIFVATYNAKVPIKYYDVEGEIVWGATAMMLSELAEILEKTGCNINTQHPFNQ